MAVVPSGQPPTAGERPQEGQAPLSWSLCDTVWLTASPGASESEAKSALDTPAWALLVSQKNN